MKALFIVIALCSAITAEIKLYKGYKVYEVYPTNKYQLIIIKSFKGNRSFDFWSGFGPAGLPTTIMVAPEGQDHFTATLEEHRIRFSVLIADVESMIREEHIRQISTTRVSNTKISFTRYNRYNEIQNYLVQLAEDYPDIVKLENIGTSFEGRNLSMIKIGTGGSDKPIILIEGGMHAREWISPAAVTYIIQELVENEDSQNLIESTDWYIIPVLNPDGYEYSHTKQRFWRKTRSSRSQNCSGVDGNRNFDFHWMEEHASSMQCSDEYAGPYPFSEPETRALRDVVMAYKDRIKLYLAFHSYGNAIMYPWAYSDTAPDNALQLRALAVKVEAAIAAASGTSYEIGRPPELAYAASGISEDWVRGVGGVDLSYTIELPGRPGGGFRGYLLPASEILKVCSEIFEGVKVYQNYIAQQFATQS